MLSLDSLLIHSIEPDHLESIFNNRLRSIEKAQLEQNFDLLKAIALIDKQNIDFLIEKKYEVGKKLHNLNQIKNYLT